MAKADKGNKAIAKRVSNLEREVGAMRATAPPRPEDLVKPDYRGAVDDRLAALQGITRRGLEADALRGAASPLGMGSYSQPVRRGRR